jgi:hypothetical protein
MSRGSIAQRLFVTGGHGGVPSATVGLPAEGPRPEPDSAPTHLDAVHLVPSSPHPVGTQGWAERHGGWILSVAFHFVLVVWLVFQEIPAHHRAASPRPIWITLESPKVPMPEPRPALAVVPTPPPVMPADLAKPALERMEPAQPLPGGGGPPGPGSSPSHVTRSVSPRGLSKRGLGSAEQGERIAGILQKYGGKPEDLNKTVDSALERVDSRLMKAEVAQAASPYLDKMGAGGGGSGGGGNGPVRTFTFGRMDSAAEKGVMALYGIQMTRRHVLPSSSGSFLSGVSGANGTVYQPAPKEGDYEVIEVPQRAQQQMAQLERQWLMMHGYSPRSTRVVSVEFGVVKQPNGQWDLGILNIKVQPIESEVPPAK